MGPDDISQGFETGSQGQEGTGINPAWNDILKYIPEEKYSEVTPVLKQWDNNFQQVQSKYKGFEPYLQAGIEPDEIEFALGLANAISTQPEEVKKALDEWLEAQEGGNVEDLNLGNSSAGGSETLGGGQGQGEGNVSLDDLTSHPQFKQLQEGFNAMAEILQQQRERELQEAEDRELEEQLNALRKEKGDFDEEFILAQLLNGKEPEEAYSAYETLVNKILTESRRPPAPKTLGGGGAIPSQEVDPRKLNPQETRNLAAQMLKQALQQQ